MLWVFFENFKLSSQLKQTPFVVRPVTRGKVLEVSPRTVRARTADGTI